MLYSTVYMQAFATASVAVALGSFVILGMQWRGQELWMRDEMRGIKRVGCEDGCGEVMCPPVNR